MLLSVPYCVHSPHSQIHGLTGIRSTHLVETLYKKKKKKKTRCPNQLDNQDPNPTIISHLVKPSINKPPYPNQSDMISQSSQLGLIPINRRAHWMNMKFMLWPITIHQQLLISFHFNETKIIDVQEIHIMHQFTTQCTANKKKKKPTKSSNFQNSDLH